MRHSPSQVDTPLASAQRNDDASSVQVPRSTSIDERVRRGRAEFQSMFADLAKGKRNWQLVAFGLLGLTTMLTTGLVTLASQSRITPYVVEVDRLGRAQAFGPAERLEVTDQRVITAQIAGFVRDIRTVLGEAAAQADLVRRAYFFVDQAAALFLGQYYGSAANDPRILGREFTRLVEITSILPIPAIGEDHSTATWKVSWIETAMPRGTGGSPTESSWEGYFTTRIVPPATVERITINPLGLYVTSINWTQLSVRTPRGAPRESASPSAHASTSSDGVPR